MPQREHSKPNKDHTGRATRVLVAWFLVIVTWLAQAEARATKRAPAAEPAIRRGVATAAAMRLRSGFAIALRQVQELPACHALFESLGSDPEKLLLETDYSAATPELERSYCSRRAVAVTNIGQPLTWVCWTFSELTAHQAAIVLIHEALHVGGLPESPRIPNAMTSQQINTLVMSRCRP